MKVSVFCMQIYSFPSNVCWRGCLFSIVCFWHLCQKIRWVSCVDSYLGFLFCYTGLHVCFCASNMLFYMLLWVCSIVWSQVLWYLHCSFCLDYLLSFVLPNEFRLITQSLWWSHWSFDGEYIEHVDCFW
jgi:hypothetical protein